MGREETEGSWVLVSSAWDSCFPSLGLSFSICRMGGLSPSSALPHGCHHLVTVSLQSLFSSPRAETRPFAARSLAERRLWWCPLWFT